MAQRWTGYTSGTKGLIQQIQEDRRMGLEEQKLKSDDAYKNKMADFANQEKIRNEEWRSEVREYQEDAKIRNDNIRIEDLKAQSSRDTATAIHRSNVVQATKDNAIREDFRYYGFDPYIDRKTMTMYSPTISDPNNPNKRIANPEAVKLGASVDVEGNRFIPVQEKMQESAVINAINKQLGIQQGLEELQKVKSAKLMQVDPFLTDPEEGEATLNPLTWGKLGFDEEEALDNLWNKRKDWAMTAEQFNSLPRDDPKRMELYNSFIRLRDELKGEKYEGATEFSLLNWPLESEKYGKVRKALITQLSSHINSMQK